MGGTWQSLRFGWVGEKELGVISRGWLLVYDLRVFRIENMFVSIPRAISNHLKPTSCYCSVLIAWSETIDGGASEGTWHSADETNAIAETCEGNYVKAGGVMIVRGCCCCI